MADRPLAGLLPRALLMSMGTVGTGCGICADVAFEVADDAARGTGRYCPRLVAMST